MDVDRNHLVTDVVYNGMSEEDKKAYIPVPKEAASMMDLGEGDTLSLVRVEVLSCGKYKIISRNIVQESVSFPDQKKIPAVYGWVCPVCGRGNGPFTSTCPCVPIEYKITC